MLELILNIQFVDGLTLSPKPAQIKPLTPQNSPGSPTTINSNIFPLNLEKTENIVNTYDQTFRKLFSEAKQLEDDHFPNTDILIDR